MGTVANDKLSAIAKAKQVNDYKADIKDFQKEATQGKDTEVKAFAVATLPTLKHHLQAIQAIATAAGIKE